MTAYELYTTLRTRLASAKIPDPELEATLLIGHYTKLSRSRILSGRDIVLSGGQETEILLALEKRLHRIPLQYILGEWEFMGMNLSVGEGVLIPREDTEVLVREAAKLLPEGRIVTALDLCAGSGAVSLGLCSLVPSLEITAIELFYDAISFLEENTARYPQYNITVLNGDIFDKSLADSFYELDLIASNPPYIKSRDISLLQYEVQLEPPQALDGGKDGLDFYRAIAQLWMPRLKRGGVLAVEIDDTQAEEVCGIFSAAGLFDINVRRDLSGLCRAVTGTNF